MTKGSSTQDTVHDRAMSSDQVWVWAGPGNSLGPSVYGLADTAAYFGAENVCAMWLPDTTQPSASLDTLTGFRKVVWDITCTRWRRQLYRVGDDETERVGFFEQRVHPCRITRCDRDGDLPDRGSLWGQPIARDPVPRLASVT